MELNLIITYVILAYNCKEINVFKLLNGILQGESLSPKLFSLFIEDLVTLLNNSDINAVKIFNALLHTLLFADDMVVLAYNAHEMQEKINLVSKYFKENDLCINMDSTVSPFL